MVVLLKSLKISAKTKDFQKGGGLKTSPAPISKLIP